MLPCQIPFSLRTLFRYNQLSSFFPCPQSFTKISSLSYCPFGLNSPLIFARSKWGFRELIHLFLIYELMVTTAPRWKITLGADTVQLRHDDSREGSLSSSPGNGGLCRILTAWAKAWDMNSLPKERCQPPRVRCEPHSVGVNMEHGCTHQHVPV